MTRIEEIEARMAEIKLELDNPEADLDALENEVRSLKDERNEIMDAAEKRQKKLDDIANGIGVVEVREIETEKEIKTMEKRFTVDTPEYRDAFYAVLGDYATAEQRTIVVDTTTPGGGDAIAIPKSLDEKIWDNIHAAHPILNDIAYVRSGMALEVTKHTAIAARVSKKLDSAANAGEEENTFVKVVLFGYDYEKYVELTYAEAKMSAGALEDYLAQEISAELGEALAKDVFAQVLTDVGAGQKVTSTSDYFADIKSALALATLGGQKVIYAPAADYYEIVGAINGAGGNPFNIGATLGCEVKLDTAATKVTVLDPKMFVLNEVQSILVESDKDVKNHKVIVSGYLRAQGTMRNVKAAAYIA